MPDVSSHCCLAHNISIDALFAFFVFDSLNFFFQVICNLLFSKKNFHKIQCSIACLGFLVFMSDKDFINYFQVNFEKISPFKIFMFKNVFYLNYVALKRIFALIAT